MSGATWVDAFHRADRRSIPAELVRTPDPGRVPCTAADLGLPDRMDGDGPLVSVVVPTYRDADCLPDALESVGAQTHSPLELLVVDSSGVSWVESLAADRDWIHYLPRDPEGLSAARNEGIAAASGEYVALLDADDYWHPEKLDRQLAALDPDDDVGYSAHYRLYLRDDDLVTCRDLVLDDPARAYLDRLQGKILVTPSTLLLRRSAMADRPFEESLDACEDFAFLVDLFRDHPPVHLPDPLCVKRVRGGTMTDDSRRIYEAMDDAIDYLRDRHPDLETPLDRCRALREFRRGRSLLLESEKRRARRHFGRSIRLDPPNYRAVVLYLASLLPVSGHTAFRTLQYVRNAALERVGSATGGPPRRREVTVTGPGSSGMGQ